MVGLRLKCSPTIFLPIIINIIHVLDTITPQIFLITTNNQYKNSWNRFTSGLKLTPINDYIDYINHIIIC
jgi:hypothetical protein